VTTVFWASVALVVYVYAGYPLLLFLLSRVWYRRVRKAPITPSVTMIIAAYNEQEAIAAKLDNTLGLDYPPDRLQILVASDGSTDETDRIVRERYAGRVTLLALPREGKTAAQNKAAAAAGGEILVFSDATTIYERDALRAMVANYADPTVGSVGGDVRYVREGEAVAGKGRQLYWSYEAAIRRWESRIYSVMGATGCIYSLRRSLYVPLDPAAISDFVQPAKATLRGFRSVVEDHAVCTEVAESTQLGDELNRRARVVLRGLRGIGYMPECLHPLRHPWICFQVISHRLLRWGVPVLMIAALASNAFLLDAPLYVGLFVLQVGLYASALAALILDRLRIRAPGLFVPLYFCMINLAPLLAVWSLLKGEKKVVWETGPQGSV
jgi:cellulose synthase/poly-beta-1,6-N-acetylglucosamine synthase-like glycosyltransferase